MDEPAMLAHWVAWYEALGVDLRSPARTRVWVHVPRGAAGAPRAKATMAVLARVAGVNASETYSSPVKQALANAFMDSLPRDALLVYPDSDEFFAYPCDVEAVVARCAVRIGTNGSEGDLEGLARALRALAFDSKTARVYDAVVHVLPDAAKVLGAVAKL